MLRLAKWIAITSCWLSTGAVAADFDFAYQSYVGYFDSDGLQDIYLRYEPVVVPIPLDDIQVPIPLTQRKIGEFVLQQQIGGAFTVVPITSAQRPSISNWTKAGILHVIDDFDRDGNLDVVLKQVGAVVSGAHDSVVLAPASVGSPPVASRAFDAAVQQFATDVNGRADNPAYFQSGWVLWRTRYVDVYLPTWSCSTPGLYWRDLSVLNSAPDDVLSGPGGGSSPVRPADCGTFLGNILWYDIRVDDYSFDESRFSSQALSFLETLAPYIDRSDSFTIPSAHVVAARNILSSVFGTALKGPIPEVDVDVPAQKAERQGSWDIWRAVRTGLRRCVPCLIFVLGDLSDNEEPQELYTHYGYAKFGESINRYGLNRKPTYCTPTGLMVSGRQAQHLYGLPVHDANDTPPDSYYLLSPSPGFPIFFSMIHGQVDMLNPWTGTYVRRNGGGVEYIAPNGAPPAYVRGPFPLGVGP